jgi:ankyrin repeat protein
MTDSRCPVFLIIAVLGLQLTIPALGQSHPTVPGQSLESMKGVTDPNAMNEAWQTALMAAAFNSDEKLVKDLIERKANVNVGSRFGMTALMYARGLPVAKLLLSAGASVKDKDITGKTALYWATQRADPEVVQVLLEAGASVNAKDDKGMSAPQLAKAELLSSENDFSDKDMRDAYKARVQKVIDLLVASEARKDYP